LDSESVELDNHGSALTSTSKTMVYTNLLDKKGRDFADFPNFFIDKKNLITNLYMNNIPNYLMTSWQFRPKKNTTVTCSNNAFVTCVVDE